MKRILSVLLWVSLLLTGCYAEEPNGPENPPVEGSIVLEYSDFVVEFYARNYSIGVSAPYAWKAVSNVDWITVDDTIYEGNPDSSVFTRVVYRVESNKADTAREGTITFKCDDYNLSTQLYIYQNAFSADAVVDYLLYAMVAPYSVFGSGNNFGFDFGYPGLMCAMDACTGDVICTAGDAAVGYDWFWYWEAGIYVGPTMTIPMFPWNAYHWFISLCNDIIGTLGADTLSSDSEKSAVGAAKAIRATIYLDMARQYEALEVTDPNLNGSYNISDVRGLTVPIVTENTTVEVAQNNPRATREEMFEFIFQDLDDAEKLLDGIYLANKELPSLAVLYGLKARAYLWLGQFNEGYPNVKTGQAAYQEAAMYARKAISQSNATIMTEKEWLNPITGFNTANNSWMWYLPQSEERIGNLVNYIAWRSCEATWGYGGHFIFEGVTNNFYNRISESDWRRKAFVSADPAVWYRENNALTNYMEEDFLTLVPAYANMKFHPANGNTLDYNIGGVTDVPLMRVEEMYLIEAEATAQYDKMAGENLLKAFMANRDPKYTTDGVTDIIDEIIFQKRVELWGEGIVFYDFKRLNMGIQNGYVGTNVPADSRVNTTGRAPWWNFCIPEDEVLHNTALEGKNNPDPDGLVGLWRER